MKTTFILSCFFVGGSFFLNESSKSTNFNIPEFKSSTARRSASAAPVGAISIVIDKSDYELNVFDSKGWYATYPVVFGNNSLSDKKMEGDKNTPEGTFRIMNKRVHDKWTRFIGIDYPTQESLSKFQERKRRGEIPSHAKPGAGIGIHGVYKNDDFMIDRYKNWTNGCIALKNRDVEEIYKYVPVGTPVTIRK
ncbi:MAG: L,D-transpeptidase [Flavisolibacter sp.]|jgi:murein L,D-transpeptidase YafK|nr:L,D-transpeptidase [Flavisolibacter sp.]